MIGYDELRRDAAAVALPRDVVAITGADAASYLQGQCSQDIESLEPAQPADALLLSPQGKVDAFVRVTRTAPDAFVVDTDQGWGELVIERLARFRLRVKVEFETLPWSCVAVRGPRSGPGMVTGGVGTPAGGTPTGGTPAGGTEDHARAPGAGEILMLSVAWPGWTGFDLLGPTPSEGSALDAWIGADVVRSDADAWEAVRIEAGVPVNGREITRDTIPAEVGLVERTVSFTKGCYTGQELVARLDARGSRVARSLGAVVTEHGTAAPVRPGVDTPPVGATVWTADGAHQVGQLSSVAWSPGVGATVALALLHRRVSPPEPVLVRWGEGGDARQVPAVSTPVPLGG